MIKIASKYDYFQFKIVEDKKGESNQANKKALDLLLKPANPTPSNTGSTRPFQRDTERRIKVLWYCEVLQRGGPKSIPMCDQSTACNPDWHIRHRQSTTKWVLRVTPDLVQHTQHCHRSTMGKITVRHATSEKAGTTDYAVHEFKVCIGSRTPHCRTVFQNWEDKKSISR